MDISIVIPNFNGRSLLEKNLQSVLSAKRNKKNKIKEIIIVDDASSDDSVDYLKKNFKDEIKLVVHKLNRGFASSVNTGARTAKGDFVCLLNTDVIPSDDFLETMDEDFKDEQVFAVSLHEKGYGFAFGKFKDGYIVHGGVSESKKVENTFWANGGSGVFRRETWMELKGMDEAVLSPFYWEDIDLSYRAQKRGYKVLWDSRANVIHEHEATMKRLNQTYVNRIRERNQLLFIWKNLTSSNLMKKHTVAVIKRVLRHPGYLRIVLMARKKFKEVMEARNIELKETRVSDEAVFAKFN